LPFVLVKRQFFLSSGHEASYNPPPEFLPSQNQISKFKKKNADHRQAEFLPQK
jgi:hypothetical protein